MLRFEVVLSKGNGRHRGSGGSLRGNTVGGRYSIATTTVEESQGLALRTRSSRSWSPEHWEEVRSS